MMQVDRGPVHEIGQLALGRRAGAGHGLLGACAGPASAPPKRSAGRNRCRPAIPVCRWPPTGTVRPDLGARAIGSAERAMIVPAAVGGGLRAGDDRHARRALEPADRTLVVACPAVNKSCRSGLSSPVAAAAEHHGAGDAEGPARRGPRRHRGPISWTSLAPRANWLIEASPLTRWATRAAIWSDKLAPTPGNSWTTATPISAQAAPGRADAGEICKSCGEVDGAARNDHLARRRHLALSRPFWR